MKNIFYSLSVVAIGAAGFFGYSAKDNFDKKLAERNELMLQNDKLSKNITTKNEEKVDATDARKVALVEDEEVKAGLENAVAKERETKRSLDDIGNQLDEVVAEEKQIDEAIAEIEDLFPGTDLDGVPAKFRELEDKEKKLIVEVESLENYKTTLGEKIAKNKADIVRVESKIVESQERVRNNTFQATVTAVDSDWDFVIIGAGEKSGLTGDSKLLVQRGGRLLGKLSIYKLEANRAVADIEPGSLRNGVVLRPGDQVILEKVNSN